MENRITCARAKQIDLVDYLASFGHFPAKIRNQDYWYLSPLRTEKTPSFKVNRAMNVWYDNGTGTGGDFIDFGKLYHNCFTAELLNRLPEGLLRASPSAFSFHPPLDAGEKKVPDAGKILVTDVHNLSSISLLNYLRKRKIPAEIASTFCKEVTFLLYGKKHTVIGFPNNSGGYELRSENFKGSSSPKDISFFNRNEQHASIFEGFFNFLSYETFRQKQSLLLPDVTFRQSNIVVLNSLSFFQKSQELIEKHLQVNLFLDRDPAGQRFTAEALARDRLKYIDRSSLYKSYKDLNDFLVSQGHELRQTKPLRKRF
jgi:hypothetical protein